MPRVVVLLENGGVQVLTTDATLAVLVVDRNAKEPQARFTVEARAASAQALACAIPQIAPQRVDAIFAEVGPQLGALSRSAELGARERVQLANLAQGWFSLESVDPAE